MKSSQGLLRSYFVGHTSGTRTGITSTPLVLSYEIRPIATLILSQLMLWGGTPFYYNRLPLWAFVCVYFVLLPLFIGLVSRQYEDKFIICEMSCRLSLWPLVLWSHVLCHSPLFVGLANRHMFIISEVLKCGIDYPFPLGIFLWSCVLCHSPLFVRLTSQNMFIFDEVSRRLTLWDFSNFILCHSSFLIRQASLTITTQCLVMW